MPHLMDSTTCSLYRHLLVMCICFQQIQQELSMEQLIMLFIMHALQRVLCIVLSLINKRLGVTGHVCVMVLQQQEL